MISSERLRELLHYNPETGVFTWRIRRQGRAAKGTVAGYINSEGYRSIKVDDIPHKAHRLAWLYVTGAWPAGEIDHKNGTRSDNRLANLRDATRSQNQRNARMPRHNTSGFKGVHFDRQINRWRATIRKDGQQRRLGHFGTAAEAHAAYCKAATEIDPEFARFA